MTVKRLQAYFLIFFIGWVSIWVPTHRYLTFRYDISPWKLGGMAMYCRKGPIYFLDWYEQIGDEDRYIDLTDADRDVLFKHSDPGKMIALGTLARFADSVHYLIDGHGIQNPLVAVIQRSAYSGRRHRYVDHSCRHEFIRVDGEIVENRVCRRVDQRIIAP